MLTASAALSRLGFSETTDRSSDSWSVANINNRSKPLSDVTSLTILRSCVNRERSHGTIDCKQWVLGKVSKQNKVGVAAVRARILSGETRKCCSSGQSTGPSRVPRDGVQSVLLKTDCCIHLSLPRLQTCLVLTPTASKTCCSMTHYTCLNPDTL